MDNSNKTVDMECLVMELVVHAGDARSLAIQAIRDARAGNFSLAHQHLQEASDAMLEVHTAQTDLIQSEVNGNSIPVSLLLVHAQDHVMNAMTVKDLAAEMIQMMEERV